MTSTSSVTLEDGQTFIHLRIIFSQRDC